MKFKFFVTLILTLGCLVVVVAYGTSSAPDGINPPHAVDTQGKVIPESSATQPDKPIILSKDIPKNDPKYGELKPEAAFDHAKHNSDLLHTIDGKTLTLCVECHHTEQPSTPTGKPYLKTFNAKRTEVLTAAQLETSKEPVKSCRACHYQPATKTTDAYPPKSSKEVAKLLSEEIDIQEFDYLTNDVVYHFRCKSCHEAATKRDSTLKAPTG